jgi:hypothetical protein
LQNHINKWFDRLNPTTPAPPSLPELATTSTTLAPPTISIKFPLPGPTDETPHHFTLTLPYIASLSTILPILFLLAVFLLVWLRRERRARRGIQQDLEMQTSRATRFAGQSSDTINPVFSFDPSHRAGAMMVTVDLVPNIRIRQPSPVNLDVDVPVRGAKGTRDQACSVLDLSAGGSSSS